MSPGFPKKVTWINSRALPPAVLGLSFPICKMGQREIEITHKNRVSKILRREAQLFSELWAQRLIKQLRTLMSLLWVSESRPWGNPEYRQHNQPWPVRIDHRITMFLWLCYHNINILKYLERLSCLMLNHISR